MLSIRLEDKRYSLQVARRALTEFLDRGVAPETQTDSPALLQRRSAFVTLRSRSTGELRGCRGECRAVRPLIRSILAYSILAATDDPRFPAVSSDEVSELTIRISALTELQPIHPEQIVVGRHGLVLIQGRRSGLLLPEVPRHFGLRTADEFLEALFRKARLPRAEPWEDDLELYAFETESWSEDEEGLSV